MSNTYLPQDQDRYCVNRVSTRQELQARCTSSPRLPEVLSAGVCAHGVRQQLCQSGRLRFHVQEFSRRDLKTSPQNFIARRRLCELLFVLSSFGNKNGQLS